MKLKKYVRLFINFILVRYFNKKRLIQLDLELTRKCNFKCRYCELPHQKNQELDKDSIFKLINDYEKDLVFIGLTGGETLLYKNLKQIVKHIQFKDGIFLYLYTNGQLFEENIDILKKVDLVILSLDGPKNIHEANRPRGSFEKIIKAIDLARLHNINICFNCVLTKKSVGDIDSILDFFSKLNLKVNFIPLNRSTNITYENFEEMKSTPIFNVIDKIISFKKEKNIVLNTYSQLKSFKNPKKYKCYVSNFSTYVNYLGYFQSCCFFKDTNKLFNIKNNNFKKYFYNQQNPKCEYCFHEGNVPMQNILYYIFTEKRFIPPHLFPTKS